MLGTLESSLHPLIQGGITNGDILDKTISEINILLLLQLDKSGNGRPKCFRGEDQMPTKRRKEDKSGKA